MLSVMFMTVNSASILKTNLTRPEGGFREDVEKLVDEFRGSQHCTCTCVTCSTNLQNVFLEGISHSEAVSRLSQLKGTYTFTFLPLHAVMAMDSEKQKQYLERCEKMKYDLLQRDYLAATDQMKKTVGILSSENEQHIFKRNGTTLIHNTSKDKRGYVFMHIETENVQMKTRSKPCIICGARKIVKISSAAEAAFYRQFHVPKQLALSYKTLMNGCGVQIFEPFYKVASQQKMLHTVAFDVGLVELNKFKKEDKEAVGPKKKLSVPCLSVKSVPKLFFQVFWKVIEIKRTTGTIFKAVRLGKFFLLVIWVLGRQSLDFLTLDR